VNACEQACMSLASALGPFGEYIILIAAGLVAYFSRRQVLQTRSELGKAKVEADAYKTSLLSIRPIGELAQLSIPPLPVVRSGFSPDSKAARSWNSAPLERPPSELRDDSDRPPDEP
jgi:hypothetical protein